jgi:methyl-accepting chemotaxis protein
MTAESMSAGAVTPSGHEREVISRVLTVVMALAVVGIVVGLVLIQRIGRTYQDALAAAEGAAATAATGAESVARLADDVALLAGGTADGLEQGRTVLETAAETTADLGAAAADNLAESVEGTATLANRVAGAFEAIERLIPGNRDSAAEDLRAIADGLEPVPAQLRDLGEQLEAGADDLRAAGGSLSPISEQLATTAEHIREATASLDDAAEVAADVQAKASAASDRVAADLWLAWLALVVIGAGVLLSAYAARRAVARPWILADSPDPSGTDQQGG